MGGEMSTISSMKSSNILTATDGGALGLCDGGGKGTKNLLRRLSTVAAAIALLGLTGPISSAAQFESYTSGTYSNRQVVRVSSVGVDGNWHMVVHPEIGSPKCMTKNQGQILEITVSGGHITSSSIDMLSASIQPNGEFAVSYHANGGNSNGAQTIKGKLVDGSHAKWSGGHCTGSAMVSRQ